MKKHMGPKDNGFQRSHWDNYSCPIPLQNPLVRFRDFLENLPYKIPYKNPATVYPPLWSHACIVPRFFYLLCDSFIAISKQKNKMSRKISRHVWEKARKINEKQINRGGISGFWCLTSENLVRGDKGGKSSVNVWVGFWVHCRKLD